MPDRVTINAVPSPFLMRPQQTVVPEGISLDEMMHRSGCHTPYAYAFIGDRHIPMSRWADVYPRSSDVVSVRVLPAGDDGAKVLRTVAMIVVAVAAIYVGQPQGAFAAWSGLGATGAHIAGAAVGILGSMAVNALLPMPTADVGYNSGGDFTSSYALAGSQNKNLLFQAIPQPIGKTKMFPPYAAIPYTEVVGDDMYLRMLFCLGIGPLDYESIKIGETLLSEYSDYEIEFGYASDPPTLYPITVQENQLSLMFEKYAISYQSTWRAIVTITETPLVTRVEWLTGNIFDTYEAAAAEAFEEAETSQWSVIAVADHDVIDWSVQTTEADTDEISIDLTMPGIGYTSQTSGDFISCRIGLSVQYAETGSTSWSSITSASSLECSGCEVEGENILLEGADGGTRRFNVKWNTGGGRYNVRIKRVYIDVETNDQIFADEGQRLLFDKVYWTTLRSIKHGPPVGDNCNPNVALLSLRMKATETLNGVIDDLNLIVTTYAPVYDGEDWTVQATDNPAWQYVGLLTGNANKKPVDYSRINGDTMLDWAENCDANEYTIGMVAASKITLFEIMKQVATVGRAGPGMIDGLHSVVRDVLQTTPKQQFGPRNSWGFSGSKKFIEQPHALRCQFANDENSYDTDERIVYADSYDASNATVFEELPLTGIKSPDHVYKHGRYTIAAGKLRPETFSLYSDFEHIVCTRGDLVLVSSDTSLIGLGQFRVKAIAIDGYEVTLTIDGTAVMEAGIDYGIRIRTLTTFTSVQVENSGADTSTLVCELAPAFSALIAVGDLVSYGRFGREVSRMIIKEIVGMTDLTAKIILVDEAPGVHTAHLGVIPDYDPNITPAARLGLIPPSDPVIDWVVSGAQAVTISGALAINSMIVHYFLTSGTSASIPVIAQCRYRRSGEKWRLLEQSIDNKNFRIESIVESAEYEIQVRVIDANGIASAWVATTHTVGIPTDMDGTSTTSTVSSVGNLAATASDLDCLITWSEVQSFYLSHYRVVVKNSNGDTLRDQRVEKGITEYLYTYDQMTIDNDGAVNTVLTIEIYAVDIYKLYSPLRTIQYTVNDAYSVIGNLRHTLSLNGAITLTWDTLDGNDIQVMYYEIRAGAAGESWADCRTLDTTTDTTWSGYISTQTDGIIYVRARLDLTDSAYPGTTAWSLIALSVALQTVSAPGLSIAISGNDIVVKIDGAADLWWIQIRSAYVTKDKITKENEYRFQIPKYNTIVRVRAFNTSTGSYSGWIVEEISVAGIYSANELVTLDFDLTHGRYLNMAWSDDDTVIRPSIMGYTPSIPVGNINDSDLFNVASKLTGVTANSLINVPANWFRTNWFKESSGYFESAVLDLEDNYSGILNLYLDVDVTYDSNAVVDLEGVSAAMFSGFTVDDLMDENVELKVTIFWSTEGTIWKEAENQDYITNARYFQLRGSVSHATPLAQIVVNEGTLSIDVPDKNETGTLEMDGSGYSEAVTFTKTFQQVNSVIVNAVGSNQAWADNLSATGFTCHITDLTATTIQWSAKGF